MFHGIPGRPGNITDALEAYYIGWRWWVDVEDNYLSFLGAIDYQIDQCQCDCLVKYIWDPAPVDETFVLPCSVGNCDELINDPPVNTVAITCQYAIVYERYIKENDGIILAESALDYPGAENGEGNEMPGSNHIQMRNDSNTYFKLEELCDGNHGFYFSTEER